MSIKKNDTMEIKDWNTDYRKLDELSNWAGPLQRLMLQAIYLLALTCLLRFDEVLKIQHHHIEVVDSNYGHIRLTLPFRKTQQKGQTIGSDRKEALRSGQCSLEVGTLLRDYVWLSLPKDH